MADRLSRSDYTVELVDKPRPVFRITCGVNEVCHSMPFDSIEARDTVARRMATACGLAVIRVQSNEVQHEQV